MSPHTWSGSNRGEHGFSDIEDRLRDYYHAHHADEPGVDETWARLAARLDQLRPVMPDRRAGAPRRLTRWLDNLTARRARPRWRMPVAMATAIVLAVALVITGLPLGDQVERVSAQEILSRAQAANEQAVPAGATSYHIASITRATGPDDRTLREEIWSMGSDQQRMELETVDGNGTVISATTMVVNGRTAWLVLSQGSTTKAVQENDAPWAAPGQSMVRSGGLEEVLARFSGDGSCTDAQLLDDGTAAGRPAYVVALTPHPAGCQEQKPVLGDGVARVTLFVDKETFRLLKSVSQSDDGSSVTGYEVTRFEVDPAIPAETFTYTPPAGVTVQTLPDGASREDLSNALRMPEPGPATNP